MIELYRTENRHDRHVEKMITKKYAGVMRPVYSEKYHTWVVDTKDRQKRRQSLKTSEANEEMKRDHKWWNFWEPRTSIPVGPENGDLIWVMEAFAKTGLFYRFWTASSREDNHPEHAHSFKGVISFLADDPQNFRIDKDFEEDYSKQELAYIQDIQKRYAELDAEESSGESQENS